MSSIRDLGAAGVAVAENAERLRRAGAINDAQFAELTNGDVGPQDQKIGRAAIDALKVDSKDPVSGADGMELLRSVGTMNTRLLELQAGKGSARPATQTGDCNPIPVATAGAAAGRPSTGIDLGSLFGPGQLLGGLGDFFKSFLGCLGINVLAKDGAPTTKAPVPAAPPPPGTNTGDCNPIPAPAPGSGRTAPAAVAGGSAVAAGAVGGAPLTAGTAPSFERAAGGDYIHEGQQGASVVELKNLLRGQGISVDEGDAFTPATARAVREFQRTHQCSVDGVIGPQTLNALGVSRFSPSWSGATASNGTGSPPATSATSAPAGPVATSALPPAVSGGVGANIVAAASRYDHAIEPQTREPGGFKGKAQLAELYQSATGQSVSSWGGSYGSKPNDKSWCGIFGTQALKEGIAAAGGDPNSVRWDLTRGGMVGPGVTKHNQWDRDMSPRSAFESKIVPGTVAIMNGDLVHHVVVTSPPDANGFVSTMEGNHPDTSAGRRNIHDMLAFYEVNPAGAGIAGGGADTTKARRA